MKMKNKTQNILIIALSLVVIAMSIGFATIERNLQVSGTVNLTGNQFIVRFQDNSYEESTGSVAASAHTLSGTSGTYTVTLDKPGDFYEFTGVIENAGDFDAALKSVTLSNSLTTEQQKYVTYTVTYGSNTYTATTTDIQNITLAKKSGQNPTTENFTVRVVYNTPADESDLLTEDISNITLGVVFHFEQV